MSAMIAMQVRGVARPIASPTPANTSVEAAITDCFFAHFIPMLENQDAVPAKLLALLIP
jgi:hypothetical protein